MRLIIYIKKNTMKSPNIISPNIKRQDDSMNSPNIMIT
jgi:hypothetical protein